jgi:hypothetical protein
MVQISTPTIEHYSHAARVPFLAWNRLEGRPRTQNMDRALNCETYDPLWFFTRQWQFGEFKGEDCGSAISARVHYQATKPSHFIADSGNDMQPIDENFHFPSRVQRLTVRLNIQQKAHLGLHFLNQLRALLTTDANPLTLVPPAVISAFIGQYTFQLNSWEENEPDTEGWEEQTARLKAHADKEYIRTVNLYKNKIPDGQKVYQAIIDNSPEFDLLFGGLEMASILDLKQKYKNWVEDLYPTLNNETTDGNWNDTSMDYAFQMAYPGMNAELNSTEAVIFGNKHYADAQPDWHSADYLAKSDAPQHQVADINDYIRQESFCVIPNAAKFEGMPAKRWWEMENAKINLGNLDSDMSEVVKQIIAEFTLVYSNDWLSIPFRRKEMEIAKVNGILVKDVFGEYTFVRNSLMETLNTTDFSAHDDIPENYEWNLFHHSLEFNPSHLTTPDGIGNSMTNSFLMGSARAVVTGDPLEKIEFIRDEMDNRVWAVESVVASKVSGGKPGINHSSEIKQYLESRIGNIPELESDAAMQYSIGNSIEEHYIPFIPVRNTTNNPFDGPFASRSIALQRAWLPRINAQGVESRIRPRTAMLRKGIGEGETDDVANDKLMINEEIIPRSGITITDRYHYARSTSGHIHLWLGRSTKNGTSENSAQLGYDQVVFKREITENN